MVKQARAVATRHQLVAAAAAVFDRRGFDGATLGDIIEAGTGLSKGALYFHFQSKEELAAAVVQRQYEISLAAVEEIAATGVSAFEQIVMLCHEMGRQIVDDPIVRAGIRLTLESSGGKGCAPGCAIVPIAAARTFARIRPQADSEGRCAPAGSDADTGGRTPWTGGSAGQRISNRAAYCRRKSTVDGSTSEGSR